MSKTELEDMKNKLILLKNLNPLKFERLKGRVDALYEIENEKLKRHKHKIE